MEVETYTYNGKMSNEGLCVIGEGFVAKRKFGTQSVYLAKPHDKDSLVQEMCTAEDYHKDSEGIWVAGFDRGYFPHELDPSSEEARALDRLSRPTLRDKLKAIGPVLEDTFYDLIK